MSGGRLIAVVGPSGVGKDTLMEAMAARSDSIELVRRVITRPSDAGGEDFDSVSQSSFATMAADGAFALWWHAHGLSYGIPIGVDDRLAQGKVLLANLSRKMLREADGRFENFAVLSLVAAPDVLRARLSKRGRENAAEIEERLARAAGELPDGLDVIELDNSGSVDATIEKALRLLYPVSA